MKSKFKKGMKLWEKSQKIISGGGQLLSKKPDFHSPNYWPTYYKKAKGYKIWDLDGNVLKDFASMGIKSCTLGYANKELNDKIITAINKGSMTTLNCFEEYELAELFLDIHKWADMVRFARSGGEACAIAVRLARAYNKKKNIAFCGYHGWEDWYLSSNLNSKKNLNLQLLPNVQIEGVPSNLKNTIFPFNFNDIESLKRVLSNDIGIIIMEPYRSTKPDEKFLNYIKKICSKNKITLILDEITSGFHDNLGGKHLELDIKPDIAIFGKAIGNGYPISAVIGKKEIMEKANNTFISSLMWTERVGFSAALNTINLMKKYNVQNHLTKYGRLIKKGFEEISKDLKIDLNVGGMDSMPIITFDKFNDLTSTLFTQKMLGHNYLANNIPSTSFAYNKKIIGDYLETSHDVLKKIRNIINSKKELSKNIIGDPKLTGFKRLN